MSGSAGVIRSDSSRVLTRTSATAAVLAKAVMLSGNAQAQTAEPEEPTATTLPEIVVRGQAIYKPTNVESRQYTEPLRDVPQSVTVIPRALIEEQNAVSLRDVLRNVPGISMQAGEGGGGPGGDFLSIRGFNARNDVYIDNIRDFGGYSRDPFNIDQVEVVKGPASSYTGRGSTGGSVNLVSKAPSLDSSFYRSTLGIGTDGFKRFTFDLNQELTPLWEGRTVEPGDSSKAAKVTITEPFLKTSLRLNGMWTEGDVSNRNDVEYSRWGIAPSLAFGFGHDAKLTLSYFHLEQDNVPDYGIPWVPNTQAVLPSSFWNKPSPVDFDNFYGLLDRDKEEISTDIGTLRYDQKVGDSFSLRNTAPLRPDAPRLDHDCAALHRGRDRPKRGDQSSIPGARSDRHDHRGAVRYALQLRDLRRETRTHHRLRLRARNRGEQTARGGPRATRGSLPSRSAPAVPRRDQVHRRGEREHFG